MYDDNKIYCGIINITDDNDKNNNNHVTNNNNVKHNDKNNSNDEASDNNNEWMNDFLLSYRKTTKNLDRLKKILDKNKLKI